jgi:branched-chain amino acid transport system ATP-binding protein
MLRLSSISAGYDSGTVIRNIDLTVPEGCVVALLGPNGAGKTTLLRVASGLLGSSHGEIVLDDQIVTGASAYQMASLGICHVPEGRGVFPALSVADNIRLQAPPELDRRAIKQAAEAFPRLGERLSQLAGSMSGGEQQMLALAHAYVCSPKVVLLDEVSMGLAPKIVDEIFDYLRVLASRGASLLLVEQYVSKALELADCVYIMNKGQITFVGEPYEISDEIVANSYLGALAS